MAQAQYPSSQGGDFMKMSPGEQDMVDVHQHRDQEGGEHKKKSMVGKVKDKAKKLKSKIKGSSGKKRTDEHGNEVDHTSSSSSSEEEEESPKEHAYHPLSSGGRGFGGSEEARKDGAVHGGEKYTSRDVAPMKDETSGYGAGAEQQKSRDFPPVRDEASGLQDQLGKLRVSEDPAAPAAGAAWYTQPPSSDESRKRQHEIPSALGQESAGVSSGIASSGLGTGDKKSSDRLGFAGFDDKKTEESSGFFGSSTETKENQRDVGAGSLPGAAAPEEKVPESIMKPRSGGEDETLMPISEGVDNGGRDLISSEVTDQSPQLDERSGSGESETVNKELKPSGSQKGWMQRASEGVASVKNALLGSPKPTPEQVSAGATEPGQQQQKTWTETARDAAVSAKDTVASKLPSSTGPTGAPQTQQHVPGVQQSDEEKSAGVASQALEAATGLRDTVASKLGYGDQTGTGSEVDSSTTVPVDGSKPGVTQRMMEMKDAVASKLGYGGSGATGVETGTTPADEKASSKLFTPDEHDQALSQKITDMLTLGGGKSGNNSQAPEASSESTAAAESKGMYDKVSGAVSSLLGKKTDEKPVSESTEPSLVTSTIPEQGA